MGVGKRKIKVSNGTVWEYQGEIDRAGLASGTGMAKNKLALKSPMNAFTS